MKRFFETFFVAVFALVFLIPFLLAAFWSSIIYWAEYWTLGKSERAKWDRQRARDQYYERI